LLRRNSTTPTNQKLAVRSQAQSIEERLKEGIQVENRLKAQVSDEKVTPLNSKDAGYAIQLSDYILLDVRPSIEHDRAWVKNSIWIPMYDLDKHTSIGSLTKQAAHLINGGLWDGSRYLTANERFMPDLVKQIRDKNANVIVACQKGLRSLAACEAMRKAGYKNLYWLSGGFDAADDGDFEKLGPKPFKYAGIGGPSELFGWTDVQRREAKNDPSKRWSNVGKLVLVIVAIDVLFLGGQQLNFFVQHAPKQ
jgi:rhodanese-related sulfurtransferase